LLKALPATALEGTESSASALSDSKRMRRGDAGGDLGRVEEEDRTSQEEAHKVEGDMARPDRQRMVAADATMNAGVTAEAGPAWTKEASAEEVTAMEVIAPHTTTDEAAAGETATAEASSSPAGQGEPRKITEEAMKEASTGAKTLEPPEVAVEASSNAEEAMKEADTPMPGMEIDKAADPPRVGTDADPEKVSQEIPAAWAGEGDCGEVSVTPGAAAKSASGGRTFAASTGSGAGSQSSASQLEKEWADTGEHRPPVRRDRDVASYLFTKGSTTV
jgi:hypothetical protein